MFVRYEKNVKDQNKADAVTKPKKKRRWLRVLIIIFSSIAGVILLAYIFVMLHPGFGGNVTGKDKEAYASRTDGMDTGFFVLTVIMYYHIQNQQKSE